MFPPIVLVNDYWIGDTVLLEPIAAKLYSVVGSDVYILSRYSELLDAHPVVKAVSDVTLLPENSAVIDMNDAIRSIKEKIGRRGKKPLVALPDKLKRMYIAAGLPFSNPQSARLYLTEAERQTAETLRKCYTGACVAVVPRSRHPYKDYPYMSFLIKRLVRTGYNVFVVADKLDGIWKGTHRIVGLPLRQLMVWLSCMDVVVGPDTGPMHIAAALGVKTVVVTRNFWGDLYDPYDNCEVVSTRYSSEKALYAISPLRVYQAVESQLPQVKVDAPYLATSRKSDIAIFRLDGLGGTITMADQAKKVYERTGIKPVIIARGYKDAFKDNPYISGVVEVGHVKWLECLDEMKQQFPTIAEERFGLGKWHQNGTKYFEQDFSQLQGIFDDFPIEYRKLEVHGLHHVQLTDKTLGLPYDTIDMDMFAYEKPPVGLPDEYVVFNNGVDVQWAGMRQTKTWHGWNELVRLLDTPVVHVGTPHDPFVVGAIDLRGRTNLPQFFDIVKKATLVVCAEGGLMHVAHAVKSPKVLVLRGPTRGKLFEYPGHRFVDSYICDICWSSTADWYARCPKGIDAVCMKSITPERVAYDIEEMLNETVA